MLFKTSKQRLVLIVHVRIKDCKRGIPDKWFRHSVNLGHLSLVGEVSVLNVLCQPVLDELGDFSTNGQNCSLDGLHQAQMSLSMVSNVMGIVSDGGEKIFLSGKMLIVQFVQLFPDCSITRVFLHLSGNIKETNMFIIHLLDVHRESFIPDERVGDNIVSSQEQLASVGVVSVLNMLNKPVFGHVNNFFVNGKLGCLELGLELKMLEVVSLAFIVGDLAEFHLFVVKMTPEQRLAVVIILLVIGVLITFSDAVKQTLVFIINPLVKGHETFIPNIGFRNFMNHLALISKVSVLDVLNQPVLSKDDEITVQRDRGSIQLVHKGLVFAYMVCSILFKVRDLLELSFLMVKVFLHHLHQVVILFFIVRVIHRISDGIKENNMLIINLLVVDFKRGLPDVWTWHFMVVVV